jgi:hypothetical protein
MAGKEGVGLSWRPGLQDFYALYGAKGPDSDSTKFLDYPKTNIREGRGPQTN